MDESTKNKMRTKKESRRVVGERTALSCESLSVKVVTGWEALLPRRMKKEQICR
jgi:hypothetical protein